ncbi:MAG: galactose-1-phosphate uridylyltransferase [Anaerolineaceae bacterium]|nr:galactose-1-phosphate uridylyltransferase [Anaerolineaceae bacterium]
MDFERPHRRKNILTGEWVLVSPQRAKRPWSGQVGKPQVAVLPSYDPNCYLCPGNSRSGGSFQNPDYQKTFVFDNDFAAIIPPENGEVASIDDGLFEADEESGLCRVICFSPRHDLSYPLMSLDDATAVVETWSDQTEELGAYDFINYVQVFENKGEEMGCSQPHPHSQVWSTRYIPNEPQKELTIQADYYQKHGRSLLGEYLKKEQELQERIVVQNEDFTALVPYWAIWPFEILVIAHRHVGSLPELTQEEKRGMADILQKVTTRYDNLFEVSFPYSMGFHQAPTDGKEYPGQHLHVHFYPPLLRSATVKKFMVGYEMMSMPQRDITPETAAQRLGELSSIHYLRK